MNSLIDLVHIDRSHSINGTAYHADSILLIVVGFEVLIVFINYIFRVHTTYLDDI